MELKYCLNDLFLKIEPIVQQIKERASEHSASVAKVESDVNTLKTKVNDVQRKITAKQAELSNLLHLVETNLAEASSLSHKKISTDSLNSFERIGSQEDLTVGSNDAIGKARTNEFLMKNKQTEVNKLEEKKRLLDTEMEGLTRALADLDRTRTADLISLGNQLKNSFEKESLWQNVVNNHAIDTFSKASDLLDCLNLIPQRQLTMMANSDLDFSLCPENNFLSKLRESTTELRSSSLLQLVLFHSFWRKETSFDNAKISVFHVGLVEVSTILAQVTQSNDLHVIFLYDHRNEDCPLSVVLIRFVDTSDGGNKRMIHLDHISYSELGDSIQSVYMELLQLLNEKDNIYDLSVKEHPSYHYCPSIDDNSPLLFALLSFDFNSRSVVNSNGLITEQYVKEWLCSSLEKVNSYVAKCSQLITARRLIQPVVYFINLHRSVASADDLVSKAKEFLNFAKQYPGNERNKLDKETKSLLPSSAEGKVQLLQYFAKISDIRKLKNVYEILRPLLQDSSGERNVARRQAAIKLCDQLQMTITTILFAVFDRSAVLETFTESMFRKTEAVNGFRQLLERGVGAFAIDGEKVLSIDGLVLGGFFSEMQKLLDSLLDQIEYPLSKRAESRISTVFESIGQLLREPIEEDVSEGAEESKVSHSNIEKELQKKYDRDYENCLAAFQAIILAANKLSPRPRDIIRSIQAVLNELEQRKRSGPKIAEDEFLAKDRLAQRLRTKLDQKERELREEDVLLKQIKPTVLSLSESPEFHDAVAQIFKLVAKVQESTVASMPSPSRVVYPHSNTSAFSFPLAVSKFDAGNIMFSLRGRPDSFLFSSESSDIDSLVVLKTFFTEASVKAVRKLFSTPEITPQDRAKAISILRDNLELPEVAGMLNSTLFNGQQLLGSFMDAFVFKRRLYLLDPSTQSSIANVEHVQQGFQVVDVESGKDLMAKLTAESGLFSSFHMLKFLHQRQADLLSILRSSDESVILRPVVHCISLADVVILCEPDMKESRLAVDYLMRLQESVDSFLEESFGKPAENRTLDIILAPPELYSDGDIIDVKAAVLDIAKTMTFVLNPESSKHHGEESTTAGSKKVDLDVPISPKGLVASINDWLPMQIYLGLLMILTLQDSFSVIFNSKTLEEDILLNCLKDRHVADKESATQSLVEDLSKLQRELLLKREAVKKAASESEYYVGLQMYPEAARKESKLKKELASLESDVQNLIADVEKSKSAFEIVKIERKREICRSILTAVGDFRRAVGQIFISMSRRGQTNGMSVGDARKVYLDLIDVVDESNFDVARIISCCIDSSKELKTINGFLDRHIDNRNAKGFEYLAKAQVCMYFE